MRSYPEFTLDELKLRRSALTHARVIMQQQIERINDGQVKDLTPEATPMYLSHLVIGFHAASELMRRYHHDVLLAEKEETTTILTGSSGLVDPMGNPL